MADISPITPGGALPPKPAEASKVQPKKETVRINLPPKPTSAPTIKLPTLAPGGSASSAPSATAAPVAAPVASRAPAPPSPPAAGTAARVAGPATGPKSAVAPAAVAAPRPMAMPIASGLTTVDKALAIAAAVVSLASLGIVLYLAFILKDTIAS